MAAEVIREGRRGLILPAPISFRNHPTPARFPTVVTEFSWKQTARPFYLGIIKAHKLGSREHRTFLST